MSGIGFLCPSFGKPIGRGIEYRLEPKPARTQTAVRLAMPAQAILKCLGHRGAKARAERARKAGERELEQEPHQAFSRFTSRRAFASRT